MADYDFYSGFQGIPEFAEASDDDKKLFGKIWAEEMIKADPEAFATPEDQDAFFAAVDSSISDNIGGIFGSGITLGEVEADVKNFVGGVGDDFSGLYNRVKNRSFKENIRHAAWTAEDIALHTAGIPGRWATGAAQLTWEVPGFILEKAGLGDSAANKWIQTRINELESTKQAQDILKSELSKYEPGILTAGLVGGGAGYWMQHSMAKALNATTLLGTPGYSAADAAIVSSYSAMVGEGAVVTPAMMVTDHYISKSGYTDETKQILQMTMPILTGIVSGATFEYRIDKILRNPTVVNRIESLVRAGAGPEEVAGEVSRLVKAPKLFDDAAKSTNGIVAARNVTSHAERQVSGDAMTRYFNSWTGKVDQPVTTSKTALDRYYDSWTQPESALARYYDSWTRPQHTVELAKPAIPTKEIVSYDTSNPIASTPSIKSYAFTGPQIAIKDVANDHAPAVATLSKYFPADDIKNYLGLDGTATHMTQSHVDNMMAMVYRIPQGNTWTPEMFDDMIKGAQHVEALHTNMAKISKGKPTSSKMEILAGLNKNISEGRFDPSEAAFLSKMINVLKKPDLFKLVVTTEDLMGKSSVRGSYSFGKNLIKLKDSRALPHEIGHWGFYNGISSEERIKFLELTRDKLANGWLPGQQLVNQKFAQAPFGTRFRSNKEQDVTEYFAEQYAQWMYTRHGGDYNLLKIFQNVNRWMQMLFDGMRNERLLDQDMLQFFERFAVIDKKQTLLFGDVEKFNNSIEKIGDIIYSTRNYATRLKAGITDPEVQGDPFTLGPGYKQTRRFFAQELKKAVEDGILVKDDARKLYHIADEKLSEMLFDPRNSTIARISHDMGLTGVDNPALHRQWTQAVANQGGYVTPDFLRTTAIHSVPVIYGMDVEDGKLTFSPEKYLKGAAVWYGLGIGGRVYRKVGVPGKIRQVSGKFADKFWGSLMNYPKETPLRDLTMVQALKRLGGPILNSLRPTEGIDPDVWALGRKFRAEHRQIRFKFEEFAAYLKKNYTPEEREMISDWIEKEGDWAQASKALQEQARECQKMMSDIREQLINSGVDSKVVNRYGDQYLHRVYIPKLANKKIYSRAKKQLKTIQSHYLMRRGKTSGLKSPERKFDMAAGQFKKGDKVHSFIDKQNRKRWAHASQKDRIAELTKRYGKSFSWTVDGMRKGELMVHRPWTKSERTAMGEARDVALRMAVFFRESAHDIALGHMFKTVDGTSGYTLKVPKGLSQQEAVRWAKDRGYTWLPDTMTTHGMKKFGAIGGQFVRDDVVKVMENLTGARYTNEMWETCNEFHKIGLRAWKVAKTAYNPATHALNSITNLHLCVMDGRNPITTVFNGINLLARKGPMYREALEAGLLDSGIMKAEWDLDAFVTEVKGLNPNDIVEYGKVARAMAKAWKGTKTVAGAPIKLYEWEDEVFKLGVFMSERQRGSNPEDALAAANKLFFDYSDVPSGVAFLRDKGVLPFVTYTYKVMPMIAKTFVDHPERMLGLLIAYKAASDWTYENEFGKKAQQQKELEEAARPEWQQKRFFGVGPSTQIRLPTDKETGEARFLDVGRYIPGADLFQDTVNSFPFGTHPIVSLLYGFASNKHPAFDRPLMPHEDPKTKVEHEQNLDASVSFIANTLLPNVPGIPYTYASERVGNALVATGTINENSGYLWEIAQERGWTGVNYFGHDVDLAEELATVGGVRFSRTDVPQALDIKQKRAMGRIRKAKTALRSELRSHKTTPARQEEAAKNFEQTVMGVDEELLELSRLIQEAQ
jgi:hypothetical protein